MNDNYRRAEQIALDEIAEYISPTRELPYRVFDNQKTHYAIALALHRLANAWERRVEIAEATAKQKGVIE